MYGYRVFHLDPTLDLDQAIDAYARQGWELWDAGRGTDIMLNGALVHVLWLRRPPAARTLASNAELLAKCDNT